MSEYGKRLIALHLLKLPELDLPNYDDKAGVLYINKEQYFEGVSRDIWSYQIGGYQVCDKWLKDRKERVLSLDEIQTYCRIVTAINKTIEIQKSIDEVYNDLKQEIISL